MFHYKTIIQFIELILHVCIGPIKHIYTVVIVCVCVFVRIYMYMQYYIVVIVVVIHL